MLEDLLVGRVTELVAAIGVGLACPDRPRRLVVGDQEFFCACCSPRPGFTARRRVRADGSEPADDGQLAFSETAVERTLRTDCEPTIGTLLVADKDDVVIESTGAGTTAPMAVARDAWADRPDEVPRRHPAGKDLARAVRQAVRAVAALGERDLEPA